MSKGYTEIVYILDRSGSMGGLELDTIGGFNSMIRKQRETGEKAYVSTILFDDVTEVLHNRVDIREVRDITSREYYVRGCTALLDAVGGAIRHTVNVHMHAPKGMKPNKTIFVITTDGMENASCRYSYGQIEKMIRLQQEKYGWQFIFIGANIDSYAEAQRFGIKKERAVNYMHDEMGTKKLYEGVSKAVCSVMMAGSAMEADVQLDCCDWDDEIRMDYEERSARSGR